GLLVSCLGGSCSDVASGTAFSVRGGVMGVAAIFGGSTGAGGGGGAGAAAGVGGGCETAGGAGGAPRVRTVSVPLPTWGPATEAACRATGGPTGSEGFEVGASFGGRGASYTTGVVSPPMPRNVISARNAAPVGPAA